METANNLPLVKFGDYVADFHAFEPRKHGITVPGVTALVACDQSPQESAGPHEKSRCASQVRPVRRSLKKIFTPWRSVPTEHWSSSQRRCIGDNG